MKFEVPRRYILRLALSTNMVQWVLWWERQGPMVKKYCFNEYLMIFSSRREDKDKKRQKSGQT